MAITKIGAPLSGIRGTLGGVIYSANKSGTYCRSWSPPSNPRTPNQTTERGYLSSKAIAWRAMSDAQRAAWDVFAALPAQELTNSLGEAYYASGWNWFCRCNIRLDRVGLPLIEAVPTQARPGAPTIDAFRVCVAGSESDECEGGIISASSADPVFPAALAFDGSLNNLNSWLTPGGTVIGWLEYQFAAPVNIKRYRIYPRDNALPQSPADWTFEFHTGLAWIPLHTVTGEVYGSAQWYDYYIDNVNTGPRYRINITANQGSATRLAICEMEMYLGEEGSSVVCYPEDDFANAPDYDLILHISQGQTVGKQVQYPGFLEVLALQDPGRWFETFQEELEAAFGTIIMDRSWFARLFRQTTEGIRSTPATARAITIGG